MLQVTSNALRQQVMNNEGRSNSRLKMLKSSNRHSKISNKIPIIVFDNVDFLNCFAARRLERNIKDALNKIGDDKQQLQNLLKGKRVHLAEELSMCQFFLQMSLYVNFSCR